MIHQHELDQQLTTFAYLKYCLGQMWTGNRQLKILYRSQKRERVETGGEEDEEVAVTLIHPQVKKLRSDMFPRIDSSLAQRSHSSLAPRRRSPLAGPSRNAKPQDSSELLEESIDTSMTSGVSNLSIADNGRGDIDPQK